MEPSGSNSRFTAQVFVDAPVDDCTVPFDASAMLAPSTSTGPRINFAVPLTSQVTKGIFGSSICPGSLNAVEQSSSSNSFWISGVIQFRSLASTGVACSEAGVSAGAGSVASVPSAASAPSTELKGKPWLVTNTARNSNFAEALISASVFSSGTPGIDTIMFVSPWVVT